MCLEPYGGPRGGAVSYERGTPVIEGVVGVGVHAHYPAGIIGGEHTVMVDGG